MNLKIFGYKPSVIEAVIGAAVLMIIILWLYKKLGIVIKERREASEQNKIKQQVDEGALSFDLQTYKNMADKLQEAMAHTNWGTDEDSIYSVFKKCENTSDVLKLITIFGTRDYKNYLGIGSSPKSLSGWLSAQLSLSELEKVNKILADKQINIQF